METCPGPRDLAAHSGLLGVGGLAFRCLGGWVSIWSRCATGSRQESSFCRFENMACVCGFVGETQFDLAVFPVCVAFDTLVDGKICLFPLIAWFRSHFLCECFFIPSQFFSFPSHDSSPLAMFFWYVRIQLIIWLCIKAFCFSVLFLTMIPMLNHLAHNLYIRPDHQRETCIERSGETTKAMFIWKCRGAIIPRPTTS